MLVAFTSFSDDYVFLFFLLGGILDFLAVRKIPIKERPFLIGGGDDGLHSPEDQDVRKEDVKTLTREMQKVVLTDRDFHEKVSHYLPSRSHERERANLLESLFFWVIFWPYLGRESLCLVRARVFKTRGVIYIPTKRPRSRRGRDVIWITPPTQNA